MSMLDDECFPLAAVLIGSGSLVAENAPLHDELRCVQNRPATMERIITDGHLRLAAELTALARTN